MAGAKKDKVFDEYQFIPIGVVHSCFKEKFGIPRQPGIIPEARAVLELLPPYNRPESLDELSDFSHIWLIFVFHQAIREEWSPTVRPPRLGGNKRIGVFASRAPFRPNPIGLSVVALEKIECEGESCLLYLQGVDLVDGTPVLDIKPYVPYSDALLEAKAGYAAEYPEQKLVVNFTQLAEKQIAEREQAGNKGLHQLITQVLAQDPRPAYYVDNTQGKEQVFGMRLFDFDLKWRINHGVAEVTELQHVNND
jgi:tRNA-Thr(GGU) m(6)t(6)A37 methyltransferase TsaA